MFKQYIKSKIFNLQNYLNIRIYSNIKKHKIDNNVIYGLDADLIMLSLISTSDNIQLLRETTEYKIENIDSDYVYLDIKKLKRQIINKIKP